MGETIWAACLVVGFLAIGIAASYAGSLLLFVAAFAYALGMLALGDYRGYGRPIFGDLFKPQKRP